MKELLESWYIAEKLNGMTQNDIDYLHNKNAYIVFYDYQDTRVGFLIYENEKFIEVYGDINFTLTLYEKVRDNIKNIKYTCVARFGVQKWFNNPKEPLKSIWKIDEDSCYSLQFRDEPQKLFNFLIQIPNILKELENET